MRIAWACLLWCLTLPVLAGQLLFDDFDGPTLDTSTWGLASWFIGDRTQFGNQPVFETDGVVNWVALPLDTYNPNYPGQRVLGAEIYSLEAFDNTGGIEFSSRARLRSNTPGLVAAFFTYNAVQQQGNTLSDEIDFEVLSKQPSNRVLMTSWNDWGAPGSDYGDGVHHRSVFHDIVGYDWYQWNDYSMRWYPDRVEWWMNGVLIETHTAPVPDMPQPIRASLWAAGTGWTDAYDAALQPVADPAANQRHVWEVDYIRVTRLGGLPPAVEDLNANVQGSEVQLSWSDVANNEAGYRLYRAAKPKGKRAAEYTLAAVLPADSEQATDQPGNGSWLYMLRAFNADGESADSNVARADVGKGGGGGGRGKKPR